MMMCPLGIACKRGVRVPHTNRFYMSVNLKHEAIIDYTAGHLVWMVVLDSTSTASDKWHDQ